MHEPQKSRNQTPQGQPAADAAEPEDLNLEEVTLSDTERIEERREQSAADLAKMPERLSSQGDRLDRLNELLNQSNGRTGA
ncbi:MAG: hypothetical protein DCC75_03215 [Proteobacteria bacterium]|nr:MAG: hypothetical protein DCC75_03215 [Pseudomonadota bacterium]